jgi:hypothetical protein
MDEVLGQFDIGDLDRWASLRSGSILIVTAPCSRKGLEKLSARVGAALIGPGN